MHRLHAGSAKSQTKQRRRHSQQCRLADRCGAEGDFDDVESLLDAFTKPDVVLPSDGEFARDLADGCSMDRRLPGVRALARDTCSLAVDPEPSIPAPVLIVVLIGQQGGISRNRENSCVVSGTACGAPATIAPESLRDNNLHPHLQLFVAGWLVLSPHLMALHQSFPNLKAFAKSADYRSVYAPPPEQGKRIYNTGGPAVGNFPGPRTGLGCLPASSLNPDMKAKRPSDPGTQTLGRETGISPVPHFQVIPSDLLMTRRKATNRMPDDSKESLRSPGRTSCDPAGRGRCIHFVWTTTNSPNPPNPPNPDPRYFQSCIQDLRKTSEPSTHQGTFISKVQRGDISDILDILDTLVRPVTTTGLSGDIMPKRESDILTGKRQPNLGNTKKRSSRLYRTLVFKDPLTLSFGYFFRRAIGPPRYIPSHSSCPYAATVLDSFVSPVTPGVHPHSSSSARPTAQSLPCKGKSQASIGVWLTMKSTAHVLSSHAYRMSSVEKAPAAFNPSFKRKVKKSSENLPSRSLSSMQPVSPKTGNCSQTTSVLSFSIRSSSLLSFPGAKKRYTTATTCGYSVHH
ncbi:hypothetical protein SODALDRAFT_358414 [Sodiomyces alkalinus F11]|uniref:Uncharacterized protein n=1 Tax=Sodiomyces alkalinus (strain CBS 110278 / VKM F-3762 / F11) TaxID=1314773 RepID=A0A3N2PZS0_SODAK|nr:hypothetical protein SODALDRAFT_358414 [Sodiomyces alkalinus F11]ROT39997.1 hypothetical protein SODALDRAFT_358414 [Sodiomyces alkalinus F11]